ncbi:hypothetical protein ACFO9E_34410 [Streptomyces maoxianensis]|uniref:Uncharacterized protein n=1 Tax=Streptomyces maoxianensis TaxID=1459942 RepID=A0ABV9GES3_9ACTN
MNGPAKAAALIGQGQVQVNPLNMAPGVATVKSGRFRQHVLTRGTSGTRELATASRWPPKFGT